MTQQDDQGVSLKGLRVMVIDDSKTIRRTAETLLVREGCDVVVGNDIDPSVPPNDSAGAPAEANGFADGDGRVPERSPPDVFAKGFDSTSVNPMAVEFVDSGFDSG